MKLVFIAGPFTGPTAWDIAQNVRRAEELGLEVARAGFMPVIPHANTALFHGQCTEEFWYEGTRALLCRCDMLIRLPGWESSKGAKCEVGLAWARGIPICDTIEELRGVLDPF